MRTKKPFTVVRHEDLNNFPELRLPVECEVIEMLQSNRSVIDCLCSKSEPLIVQVRLPKTGFGLGETILVRVALINKSSTDVSRTIFTVYRVDTFNSSSPRVGQRIVKECVTEAYSPGVKGGETVYFEKAIEIPKILMTSNNKYCRVFQTTFELRIMAKTIGMFKESPKVYIPITVGSVGLTDEIQVPFLQPSAPQDFRKIF